MSSVVSLKPSQQGIVTLKSMNELLNLPIYMLRLLHSCQPTMPEQTQLCCVIGESGQVRVVLSNLLPDMDCGLITGGAIRDTGISEIWTASILNGYVYLDQLKSRQLSLLERYRCSLELHQEFISHMGNITGEQSEWMQALTSLKRWGLLDTE